MAGGFASAASACLLLVALGSEAVAQSPPDTLTAAFAAEPATMDPPRLSSGVDAYFTSQIYEPLVRFGSDLKRQNWLAQSWKAGEENGKPVMDITLREGVKFHNGDPLTSEDVVFSFDRFRDPKNRFANRVASVEKVVATDPLHARIHFSKADAQFLVDNLVIVIMPKKYFEQVGEQEFARNPVGTGPWKFVSRKVKDEIRFEAFDAYWNKDARPGYKNLVIKVIPEDITRVSAYKTGQVDWIDNVPLAQVEEFRKLPHTRTATVPSGNHAFLNFNTQMANSPFRDVRVRQAVAHAIDMDAIIKAVLFGQGQRYAQVAEGSAGYDPALKPFTYDPALSRKLLQEAGFANGFDIPCYNHATPREPNIKEVGEAMYAFLGAVGIRCRIKPLEFGAYIELVNRSRPPGGGPPEVDGIINWQWPQGLPGDPGQAWAGHMHTYEPGKGWGSYSYSSDREVDQMIEKSAEIFDVDARDQLLRKIAVLKQERVLGGMPTYLPIVTFAYRDTIDWTPWPIAQWRGMQQIKPAR